MTKLRIFLVASTVGIYALTLIAIVGHGWLWPVTAIRDLVALNWRSQFNFDFVIYLVLSSCWIVWREGAGGKAYLYGFLNIFLGGMFGFPYLLLLSYRAKGDVKRILLGVNASKSGRQSDSLSR
ncbi:hypothetical protein [Roseibium alexandrii]|uniref:DUF2834 domain-containing protein n=1 Tax=Roseibium alexandrii (strain DSM 17067 / NCIMB 14079 / DFL-11) TaxID=244592 RepID=A0A5E8H572_ROSAD|nr:hypothetical protein [Roseibium alexandrii]EEE47319.2 hypothetical protein SADFL11_4608 [Roseibium alexandrii DFL-11]